MYNHFKGELDNWTLAEEKRGSVLECNINRLRKEWKNDNQWEEGRILLSDYNRRRYNLENNWQNQD